MISSDKLIKKRILITGANGLLGQRLVTFFAKQNRVNILATSLSEKPVIHDVEYISCDITNRDQFKKLALDFYPDIIINAAVYSDEEKCETEREIAWKVNAKAVEYLTEVARVMDSHIIHFSTDYVFDGSRGPYNENAIPNPLSYFARTKLASENILKLGGVIYTLVRTNFLYGINKNINNDFIKRLVGTLKLNKNFNAAVDRFNNPTFTDDLVQAVSKIFEYKRYGIFHIGGKEQLSHYDFAIRIAVKFELDKNLIKPVYEKETQRTVRFPLNSGLLIIKAETELGYKPHSIDDSLELINKEMCL